MQVDKRALAVGAPMPAIDAYLTISRAMPCTRGNVYGRRPTGENRKIKRVINGDILSRLFIKPNGKHDMQIARKRAIFADVFINNSVHFGICPKCPILLNFCNFHHSAKIVIIYYFAGYMPSEIFVFASIGQLSEDLSKKQISIISEDCKVFPPCKRDVFKPERGAYRVTVMLAMLAIGTSYNGRKGNRLDSP